MDAAAARMCHILPVARRNLCCIYEGEEKKGLNTFENGENSEFC